jgi:putative glutamine amidotransferase
MAPTIGITVDNRDNAAASGQYEAATAYARAVAQAGGAPVLLPHEVDAVGPYLALCDGLVLTGGGDPATEPFGESTDPRARVIDPGRQRFELELLDTAAEHKPTMPVLGICLGMQLQALSAGGRLDQYLPDSLGGEAAAAHQDDRRHTLVFLAEDSVLLEADQGSGFRDQGSGATDGVAGQQDSALSANREESDARNPKSDLQNPTFDMFAPTVVSSHRQAVADAGRLRVVATAPDGTIEAIDDPKRAFYLGVQWHPERGDSDGPLSHGLIQRFVAACGARCSR